MRWPKESTVRSCRLSDEREAIATSKTSKRLYCSTAVDWTSTHDNAGWAKKSAQGAVSLLPPLTHDARTIGNNRSTRICSACGLLVSLRRLGDYGRTQGKAKAEAAAAVNRRAPVAVRRPAIRRLAAPTAAPVHAERVRRGTNWIHHS